jgi:hypothetical protein
MKRRDFLGLTIAAGTVVISSPACASHNLVHQNLSLTEFIKFNFCPGTPFLRQNAHSLLRSNPNHPIIASYATAVAAMKALPNSISNSWNYQANIHGFLSGTFTGSLPAIFTTCEHHNQYFLPWHRMYLFFFEKIVRQLSGNPSFALPYWNYEPAADAGLPAPFKQSGSTLFDGTRNASLNGTGILSASARSAVNAIAKPTFPTVAGFSRTLEGTPHDAVHGAISGNMGAFSTAGHDPIFWLHHCNIDRLWEKWLSQGGRANPTTDTVWMNKTSTFADINGSFVTMKNSDVLITVSQLNYQYDDPKKCVPLIIATNWPPKNWPAVLAKVSMQELSDVKNAIAENLKPDPRADRIEIDSKDMPGNARLQRIFSPDNLKTALAGNSRIVLVFSNIKSEQQLGGFYEVYLDTPKDWKPGIESPHYVGNLTLFGADQKSRDVMHAKGDHMGMDGTSIEIDITDKVADLQARSRIWKNSVGITLVRAGVVNENGEVAAFNPEAGLEIGSVQIQVLSENGLPRE